MAKQIVFTNYDDQVEVGILTNDGVVICGSTGFEISVDDCVIITTLENWEDIEPLSMGETGATYLMIMNKAMDNISKKDLERIYNSPTEEVAERLQNRLTKEVLKVWDKILYE